MSENRTRRFITFKGKEYEINSLQEPRWGERGEVTICYINLDGYPSRQIIAKSERSPRDKYMPIQGHEVACGRLLKKLAKLEKVL